MSWIIRTYGTPAPDQCEDEPTPLDDLDISDINNEINVYDDVKIDMGPDDIDEKELEELTHKQRPKMKKNIE